MLSSSGRRPVCRRRGDRACPAVRGRRASVAVSRRLRCRGAANPARWRPGSGGRPRAEPPRVRRRPSVSSSRLRWSQAKARSRPGGGSVAARPASGGAVGHQCTRSRSSTVSSAGTRAASVDLGLPLDGLGLDRRWMPLPTPCGRPRHRGRASCDPNFSARNRPLASSLSESWRAMSSATSARRRSMRSSCARSTSWGVRPPAIGPPLGHDARGIPGSVENASGR